MIKYNPRAARAIGFLKSPYNDVEIFVEDTAGQVLWMRLLQKVIPETLRITSVTLLGGRDRVIAACKLDQSDDGRRRLYLIDGDFDFLLGIGKPNLKFLYRLRSYCVENLLLNSESVTEVAVDCLEADRKEVAAKIDVNEVLESCSRELRPLFIIYALAQKLQSGIQTVSHSVLTLTRSVNGVPLLDTSKIRRRIRAILKQLYAKFDRSAVVLERRIISSRSKLLNHRMVVSGKDYILPIIWAHLRKHCGYKGSHGQFKVHLAREYAAPIEPYLARRFRQLAAS